MFTILGKTLRIGNAHINVGVDHFLSPFFEGHSKSTSYMRKHVTLQISCANMHGMNPDWEDMKTVLHLARGESLAKAAASLGVNYTSVSR